MKNKIFLWTSLLILFISISVALLAVRFNHTSITRDAMRYVERESYAISTILAEVDYNEYQRMIDKLGTDLGVRITIIQPNGAVVADSLVNSEQLNNHSNRLEVKDAIKNGYGTSMRYSDTTQADILYGAVYNDILDVVVRIALPIATIQDSVKEVWTSWVLILLVLLCLGLFLAERISNYLTGPLNKISSGVNGIAAGNYNSRIYIEGNDELSRLADTFNSMAEQIEENIRSIEGENSSKQAIITSLSDGVIAVDDKLNLLIHNDKCDDIFSISSVKIGMNLWNVVRNKLLVEMMENSIREVVLVEDEFAIGATNIKILKVRVAPIIVDGMSKGAVALIQDITKLRKLENMRTEFVANASHELRTPLTSISGYSETLLTSSDLDEHQKKFLKIINDEASRLGRLIDDLLSISKMEKEDIANLEICDFSKVLKESLNIFISQANEKSIVIEQLIDDEIMVYGNFDHLHQLAINLIDNAIKYSPNDTIINVSLSIQGEIVKFIVKDQGIGIPQNDISRIFERFYRVDKGRSRDMGGTGLGLSIVKHIVSKMKGDIAIDSKLGEGTTITVMLPSISE